MRVWFLGRRGAAGLTTTVWVSSWKAPAASKTVNYDSYAHGDALAGAGSFLYGGGRKRKGSRRRRILRGPRIARGATSMTSWEFLSGAGSRTEVPGLLRICSRIPRGSQPVTQESLSREDPWPDGEVPGMIVLRM